MLAMSKGALTAGQAETYYEEKYSRDDYYTEKHRVVGRWFGRGAAELGLTGDVDTSDFRAVLNGVDPRSGDVLVHAAQREGEQKRAGWDATFNAPKSVSVQALVGDDTRLIGAHRRAVERALMELERFAQARIRRGQEWVTTANVVAARFDHIAARPTDAAASDGYGPDPHLHTHVVVMNMTRRPDGAWRGLDPVEIYRSQAFATAVYRAELAREVQKLGYAIAIAGSDGRWELKGYGREQVLAFSLRRQEIERELEKLGVNGAGAAQIAAHRSRLAKDHRGEQALKAEWRERAAAVRGKTGPLTGPPKGVLGKRPEFPTEFWWRRGELKIRSRDHTVKKRRIFKRFLHSRLPQPTGIYRQLSLRDNERRNHRSGPGSMGGGRPSWSERLSLGPCG